MHYNHQGRIIENLIYVLAIINGYLLLYITTLQNIRQMVFLKTRLTTLLIRSFINKLILESHVLIGLKS